MMTEKIWLQRYLNNGEAIKGPVYLNVHFEHTFSI